MSPKKQTHSRSRMKSELTNGNDVGPKGVKNISDHFNDRVRPILNLIDDLRTIGVQKCVPIPQIAVMGDQSSGKSSVLEAISGISFPRSAGLCTRCPTQVTMSEGPVWSAMVRCSNDSKTITLEDGQQGSIADVIEEFTVKLAGAKDRGGFSNADEYIEIQLTSPDVPDLTIIDLPGIIRTSTAGQSKEAKVQVNGMLERFLKQERTIILAVIPANVDIATVDILERAKAVDPEFKRTIGVLTKPDLVDQGAEGEVIEVLTNRRKPMLHGYFMVKNRSQQELDADDSPEVARRRELEWLLNSKYADAPGVNKSRLGVEQLTKALTHLLVERIEEAIPDMTKEVDLALKKTHVELSSLGKPPPKSPTECRVVLVEIISNFSKTFRKTCDEAVPVYSKNRKLDDGALFKELKIRESFVRAIKKTRPGFDGEQDRYRLQVTCTPNHESVMRNEGIQHRCTTNLLQNVLIHGDDLDRHLWKVGMEVSVPYVSNGFKKARIQAIYPCFHAELKKIIADRRGRELPGFMNFSVFCELMKGYVERWQEPMEHFHTEVNRAWIATATAVLNSISLEWPRVMRAIESEVMKCIEETAEQAAIRLSQILELEKSPMTENDVLSLTIDRYRHERKMRAEVRESAEGHSSLGGDDDEPVKVAELLHFLDMLKAYWNLAHIRFVDVVCKIVTESYTGAEKMEAIEKHLLIAIVHNAEDPELQKLFKSSTVRENRRAELQRQAKDLQKARDRIRLGV